MNTTIKVSSEVRDRLKAQASLAHRTLGEHLEHLAELDDRSRRFETLRDAIVRTSPDELSSYAAETREWDSIERG